MLLFRGNRGENDARCGKTHVLSILLDVGLAHSRESKKPQHAVGYTLKDLQGKSFYTYLHVPDFGKELKEWNGRSFELPNLHWPTSEE